MSSIGSNGDNSLSNLDWTWRDLRDRLKTQFLEQSLKECLLVLDEVNDRQCLEALDIGCKILITTRDTEVVANYHSQIVKVSFIRSRMAITKRSTVAQWINSVIKGA